jgi:hypothetical protein
MTNFFAFEPALRDGTFVAVGETAGSPVGRLVVGAGPGGAPRVVVYSDQLLASGPQGSQIASFFVGDPTGRGGVPVAARDLDGDGVAEVIAGAAPGTAPRVGIYSAGTGSKLGEFAAFEDTFKGGVFVG